MNLLRGLMVHFAALAVAGVLALYIWTRDERPTQQTATEEVEVWGGSADKVQTILFEGQKRKVRLDAREDDQGRWFVGSVERETSTMPPPRHPPGTEPQPPPKPEMKRETVRFVAVKEANELAKSLAPFMAVRRVGKIDKAREEEFGLKEPEGMVKVKIGDKEHKVVFGGTAPGATDRYVRVGETGEVFAVTGDLANRVMYAETRLLERELHEWEPKRVSRVRIEKGSKSRELLPVEGKVDGWANPDSPTKLDETAGNWMSKLGRVRVMEYVEKPPVAPRPENLVVRVSYFERNKPLGFIEVFKVPGEKEDRQYLAKTEFSRWYFTVLKSSAEQVDQDLASVLK